MPDYTKELEVTTRAAREAGVIIMESYERLGEEDIGEKGINDMVTVVDHRAQEIVVGALRRSFPGDFIIAEEDLSESVNAGIDPGTSRRWYIDPLDGTTNYIHAYPMFAVSIALEVDRELVLGVTHAPRNGEMFHAVRGGGAWVDGRRMQVSRVSARNRTLLGTGFPFRARHYLDIYLRSFAFFFNNSRGIRRAGSAALDFAYVAAGRLDGFWEMTLSPWDMAAGIVLIEEAGGRVTDFFGGREYLDQGHVVATNNLFHDWMIEELGKIFSPDLDYNRRS
jgi:myo-inositol-1(or 4)-monophosphatase